jgi:S-adenosylmethionine:tRNA ribosyltransferase-isomerase
VDRAIPDLPGLLGPGDLLVVNDVRVHPARLRAQRESGGRVEVLLVGGGEALVRPARRLAEGERLRCGPGAVLLCERRGDGRWRVECEPDVDTLTAAAGEIPLPPYLGRAPSAADAERYQTVYARPPGDRRGDLRGAAAPTAGLHLTPRVLGALDARGVRRVSLTLEVGLGTFRPLGAEQIARGALHPERYEIPAATWDAVAGAKRVVAVGTTVARALESATGPGAGVTELFIREGYPFRRVDVLLTNFHLPRSSLLMLVCAFGGRDRVLAAYAHAVASGYRFYSYGDAMLIAR